MPPKCDKCGEFICNGSCKCSYHVALFHITWIFKIFTPSNRDLTKDQIFRLEQEIGGEVYKNMQGWHMRCHSPRHNPKFNPETIVQKIIEILE